MAKYNRFSPLTASRSAISSTISQMNAPMSRDLVVLIPAYPTPNRIEISKPGIPDVGALLKYMTGIAYDYARIYDSDSINEVEQTARELFNESEGVQTTIMVQTTISGNTITVNSVRLAEDPFFTGENVILNISDHEVAVNLKMSNPKDIYSQVDRLRNRILENAQMRDALNKMNRDNINDLMRGRADANFDRGYPGGGTGGGLMQDLDQRVSVYQA